jgi:UDP-N-acetyl-D-galactosamine dehydrogenase
MLKKGIQVLGSKILVLGFTFKENCPDVRNTRVIDIVHTLEEYKANVMVYDPWANAAIAKHEYGVELQNDLPKEVFDAVILAVAHDEFRNLNMNQITNGVRVVYDVKGILSEEVIDGKL